MPGTHPLRCRCGKVQGTVDCTGPSSRAICYCRDCRAFASFLGPPEGMLNASGGTDIIPVSPSAVSLHKGQKQLACMSLSPKGMLRWYARCCRTPIGNTPRDVRMSYVGLVRSALDGSDESVDQSFGPARISLNGASATGPATPKTFALRFVLASIPIARFLLKARIGQRYRNNPFFDVATGAPVVPVQVLTQDERTALNRSRR